MLTSDRITETDILDGRWDNASVEVWRVNWTATGQRALLRRGAIGQIRRGRLMPSMKSGEIGSMRQTQNTSVPHLTNGSRRKQGIGRGTNIPDCNCQIAASSPSETLDQGAMIRSLSQSHRRARPKDEAASRHWRIWPMA